VIPIISSVKIVEINEGFSVIDTPVHNARTHTAIFENSSERVGCIHFDTYESSSRCHSHSHCHSVTITASPIATCLCAHVSHHEKQAAEMNRQRRLELNRFIRRSTKSCLVCRAFRGRRCCSSVGLLCLHPASRDSPPYSSFLWGCPPLKQVFMREALN